MSRLQAGFGRGRRGHHCRRCHCDRATSTYWPPDHQVEAAPEAHPLLGSREEFCASFFHVLACVELGIPRHVCLNANPRACRHQCVTLFVRLQTPASGAADRAFRYTTCRGAAGPATHAEVFMVEDPSLLVAGAHLVVYAELQPCHHSSGTDQYPADPRSCTTLVQKWYREELEPRGIRLSFRCANLYKAMWRFTDDELRALPPEKRYTVSTANAREGLRILSRSGIAVSAIDPDGWAFLARHADLRGEDPLAWAERHAADQSIEAFLRTLDVALGAATDVSEDATSVPDDATDDEPDDATDDEPDDEPEDATEDEPEK